MSSDKKKLKYEVSRFNARRILMAELKYLLFISLDDPRSSRSHDEISLDVVWV